MGEAHRLMKNATATPATMNVEPSVKPIRITNQGGCRDSQSELAWRGLLMRTIIQLGLKALVHVVRQQRSVPRRGATAKARALAGLLVALGQHHRWPAMNRWYGYGRV
jgi:hypothetical protein